MQFKLKKGLEIPLRGQPDQRIEAAREVSKAAVLGADYIGLKPTMLVQTGDAVKEGTPLFEDKKNPGVIITSPAAGRVESVNRGAQRALVSVVIDIDGEEAEQFDRISDDASELDAEKIRVNLQKSGLWASFRTRPYGKVPAIDSQPNSIFVNTMDTNPLALNPELVISERGSDFAMGVSILAKLDVPIHVCKAASAKLPDLNAPNVAVSSFAGPHPAGLASTHIHYLDPVHIAKMVWSIGYQDVIAIGKLFLSGRVDNTRYVAVAGPYVNSPRVFSTRQGAKISELVEGRVIEGHTRIISGSVLSGHHALANTDFLGRYDTQISIIEENDDREFMGWIAPGATKFSALNIFVSSLFKPRSFTITSSQNGSPRAMVPIGVYEKVMPLDILPTPLLRSILVKDTDSAQELGCLELVEEDLALCSFVDPGKHDFGPVLRSTLTQIEREG